MRNRRDLGVTNHAGGFTLVELLVVVNILAVPAAIAIPISLNQQRSAYGATVESDLRNLVPAVAATAWGRAELEIRNGNHVDLSDLDRDAMASMESQTSPEVIFSINHEFPGSCVTASHDSSPNSFRIIARERQVEEGECSDPC